MDTQWSRGETRLESPNPGKDSPLKGDADDLAHIARREMGAQLDNFLQY